MKVVVTGHCGFVGHHVQNKLIEAGHLTIGLDRAHKMNPVELLDLIPEFIEGSDAVIHCAAHADVRDNWQEGRIDTIVSDNDIATLALLDCARLVPTIKSFVFVSSGAVYADQMSPYAASKLAGEAWCKAYADKFGWRLSIVRPAACYGEGYHHGHIADFVRMARETGRVKALTKGWPRDGIHVEDLADSLARIATSEHAGRYYAAANERWGCRDTVRIMGVEAEWEEGDKGWLGDAGGEQRRGDTFAVRSLESAVRDSLRSLGWECK